MEPKESTLLSKNLPHGTRKNHEYEQWNKILDKAEQRLIHGEQQNVAAT
jgi:hypothetical protein